MKRAIGYRRLARRAGPIQQLRRHPWLLLIAAMAALSIALVACGSGEEATPSAAPAESTTAATPEPAQPADEPEMMDEEMDLSELGGTVEVDGSSTVFPITEGIAEEFGLLTDVRVTVGVSGSGGGFQRFCAGETDISNASRPIKESESEECGANGIAFIEVPVAFDGLTVVVNPENDWTDHLTVAELHHIFRPDDYAESWADVRAGFPDEEIVIFSPGVDSGTFDYFTETINDDSGVQRQDNTTFSEDDNVLVIGVANELGGIGYFGFSYYINNQENLQAVPIDGGAGPVFPTTATVNDGSYAPLSRPLLIYVKTSSLDRPEVAALVDYYLSDGRPIIDSPEVGYIQLPDNFYAAIRHRIANRVTGSVFPGAPEGATIESLYGVQ